MERTCPDCGTVVDDDHRFCGECGCGLPARDRSGGLEAAPCEACGRLTEADERFCGECGHPIADPGSVLTTWFRQAEARLTRRGLYAGFAIIVVIVLAVAVWAATRDARGTWESRGALDDSLAGAPGITPDDLASAGRGAPTDPEPAPSELTVAPDPLLPTRSPNPRATAPREYRVRVVSDPSGASVFVNGISDGSVTPHELALDDPTTLRIVVEMSGYERAEFAIEPEAMRTARDGLTVIHIPLSPLADEGSLDPKRVGATGLVEPDTRAASPPVVVQPVKTRHVAPEYPEPARRARIVGEVVIEAVIGIDGTVTDVRVLSGPGSGLREAAARAVSGWRYRPGTVDGRPTEMPVTVRIRFRQSRR